MKAKFILLIVSVFFSISTLRAQYNIRNDSLINQAISLINSDSIAYQLQWLQNMGTRFMIAPNHREVAENIKARFESYGITEVRLDSFQCYTNINYSILHYDTTTWQYNVEAKIIGSVYADEEIVLMGHHDNVQLDSDPEIFAPGADDNASGTVATLETARVIMEMGYQPERTIVFLTTAAEELMHFGDAGSEHYAAQAETEGTNIWGVINNDMIAYDDGSNVMTLSNVIGSEEITGVASLITSTYTSLTPDVDSPTSQGGADLAAFIDAGYHGVYLMENVFNPFYHSELDLVDNCNLDYLTEAIKISCGTILYADLTVDIDENETEKRLTVYPNPCKSLVNIKLANNNQNTTLVLYNTVGQLLLEYTISPYQSETSINMIDYPAGVYVFYINDGKNIKKMKVIKE